MVVGVADVEAAPLVGEGVTVPAAGLDPVEELGLAVDGDDEEGFRVLLLVADGVLDVLVVDEILDVVEVFVVLVEELLVLAAAERQPRS